VVSFYRQKFYIATLLESPYNYTQRTDLFITKTSTTTKTAAAATTTAYLIE